VLFCPTDRITPRDARPGLSFRVIQTRRAAPRDRVRALARVRNDAHRFQSSNAIAHARRPAIDHPSSVAKRAMASRRRSDTRARARRARVRVAVVVDAVVVVVDADANGCASAVDRAREIVVRTGALGRSRGCECRARDPRDVLSQNDIKTPWGYRSRSVCMFSLCRVCYGAHGVVPLWWCTWVFVMLSMC